MRKFPLITVSILGLALGLSVTACGDTAADDSMTMGDTMSSGGDGDGDPSGDGDPTGNTGECYDQPAECALFVECIAALVPGQLEGVEAQYGAEGSCWCGTEAQAQECFVTCVTEVDKAVATSPTEPACHENKCSLEELDPDQPYGPVENGSCSPYIGPMGDPIAQMAFMNPFGIAGSFCSPKCSGLANACPEHTQTSADGQCYITVGEDGYCVSRCYVDPNVLGGTQCQCGARCQPTGAPDGDGNMRGICTFE